MPAFSLTRRTSLLLPFLLAACGGSDDDRTSFAPLRYDYLPTIPLNVAALQTETRFVPARLASDVTESDPVDLLDAMKGLATDRLKPVGAKDRAVFAIRQASLIQRGDQITGTLEATLEILTDDGQHAGYAQARARRQHTGRIDNLRGKLYDMTVGMMDDMNVELEFQIRKNLKDWISDTVTAAPTPVSADPLPAPLRR